MKGLRFPCMYFYYVDLAVDCIITDKLSIYIYMSNM